MDSSVLLSIIIPVYNAESTLTRCLTSILNQPGNEFEIVLVNDGSTDSSQQLIEQFHRDHPDRIRFIAKENTGLGDTRNAGIRAAQGTYLAFVDSDDHVAPEYLETVFAVIRKSDPEMIVIGYDRVYERNRSFLERIHRFGKVLFPDQTVNLEDHPEIICTTEGAPWLKIIRRSLLSGKESLLFSKVMIAEDQEASLKWFLSMRRIHFIPEKLYCYTIRKGSLNFSTKYLDDFKDIIRSVCSYYKAAGVFEKYRDELELVFIKQLLISNLRRLKSSHDKEKYGIFERLKDTLITYFPDYKSNKYLAQEAIYVRLAVWLSWYHPSLFKYVL